MGLLSRLALGLARGADRTSPFTSKRGPRDFYKGRGARLAGHHTPSGKFVSVREMIPELVVPDLRGFALRPYVSYRAPPGSRPPPTAQSVFDAVVAPDMERDIKAGAFDPNALEKYGFEPSQSGKLFQLFPKNFPR